MFEVCEAKNLPSIYEENHLDVFVSVTIHPQIDASSKPSLTKIKENTLNPTFDEAFQL